MPTRESFPRQCAVLLARPSIRIPVAVFAALASLLLLPGACLGLGVFFYSIANSPLDSGPLSNSWAGLAAIAAIGTLAIAGLIGVVAAWIRLAIKGVGARIGERTYRILCIGLAAGVIDGMALTAFVATQSPSSPGLAIALALVTAVGAFLFAATLGIRPDAMTEE
jgi:hypothetical protein